MDKSQQPGISFDRVFLSMLKYVLPDTPPNKFTYAINISSTYKIDESTLIYTIHLGLYDGFELEITGIFSTIKGKENMSLAEFAKVNAPTLLIPFLRETVSNITTRTPLPHLLLPPINVFTLSKPEKGQLKCTK
jgi:preprotein translocase subunit SecB